MEMGFAGRKSGNVGIELLSYRCKLAIDKEESIAGGLNELGVFVTFETSSQYEDQNSQKDST
jgi:hypothetical protein